MGSIAEVSQFNPTRGHGFRRYAHAPAGPIDTEPLVWARNARAACCLAGSTRDHSGTKSHVQSVPEATKGRADPSARAAASATAPPDSAVASSRVDGWTA